jgi:hypothetical protein
MEFHSSNAQAVADTEGASLYRSMCVGAARRRAPRRARGLRALLSRVLRAARSLCPTGAWLYGCWRCSSGRPSPPSRLAVLTPRLRRDRPMDFLRMVFPKQAAHRAVRMFGHLAKVQFIDLNAVRGDRLRSPAAPPPPPSPPLTAVSPGAGDAGDAARVQPPAAALRGGMLGCAVLRESPDPNCFARRCRL